MAATPATLRGQRARLAENGAVGPSVRMHPALWILGGITVAAAALRFADLGAQSLWLDEWLTRNNATNSLHGLASTLLHGEPIPPLYFAATWVWTKVFGAGEVGLRSLSALVGTATVPLAYAAARTRFSARAALVAALFVAVNPCMVWFSQEARPYALLAALCLASVACLVRVIDGGDRRWLWAWAATAALALTTHFFAAFFIAGELVLLLRAQRTRETAGAVGAVGLVAVAILPLLLSGRSSDVAWVHASAPLGTRTSLVPFQFLTGQYLERWAWPADITARYYVAAAVCLIGLGVALAAVRMRRASWPFLLPAVTMVVLPIALAIVRHGNDYVLPRYLIPALVPLLIVVAAGLASRRMGARGLFAAVALAGVMLSITVSTAVRPELQRPDWRSVGRALRATPEPRAVVVDFNVQSRPLLLYVPGLASEYVTGGSLSTATPPASARRTLNVRALVFVEPVTSAARAHPTPAPGFRRTGRRTVGAFELISYTARAARGLAAGQLAGQASRVYGAPLGDQHASVVYLQRPR